MLFTNRLELAAQHLACGQFRAAQIDLDVMDPHKRFLNVKVDPDPDNGEGFAVATMTFTNVRSGDTDTIRLPGINDQGSEAERIDHWWATLSGMVDNLAQQMSRKRAWEITSAIKGGLDMYATHSLEQPV